MCADNQKLKTDGTCEDCPLFTRKTDSGKDCKADKCDKKKFVDENGLCQDSCPNPGKKTIGYKEKCLDL